MNIKPRMIVTIIISIIAIISLFILVSSTVEALREQIENTTVQLNVPVNLSTLSFSSLNQYIVSSYPEYCDGMKFVKGVINIRFRGDSILSGEAVITYFRLIDESMEGGRIEANECYFNLCSNIFTRVEHWEGSGRSFQVNNQEISGSAFTAPLSVYIVQATSLVEQQSDSDFSLRAYCISNWMDIMLLDDVSKNPLYAEHLTKWSARNNSDERSYVLTPI